MSNFKYDATIANNARWLKSIDEQRKTIKLQRYQMELEQLAEELPAIDVEQEVDHCAGMDQRQFDDHLEKIRRENASPTSLLEDPDVERKIHRYMRDNPEFTQQHGEKAFKEAAKILKFA